MTVVSLSSELVTKTCALLPISLMLPQELQTYTPSFGNIIEPHVEQNKPLPLQQTTVDHIKIFSACVPAYF